MKLLSLSSAALAVALMSSTASAQLRPPRDLQAPAPQAPAPAAPSTGDAPAKASPEASAMAAMIEAGGLAAGGWLILLDRRNWGAAWEGANILFRNTVPLSAWMDGIPKVRDGAGALVERSATQAFHNNALAGRPVGDYVTTIFKSKYQNKELEELVTTVRDPDGKWRVTGYSAK